MADDDRSRSTSYQQSNPAIGIPIPYPSSIAVGIPCPNTTTAQHQQQPRPFNPPRTQTPPQPRPFNPPARNQTPPQPRPFNPPRNQTQPQSPQWSRKKQFLVIVIGFAVIFALSYVVAGCFFDPRDPKLDVETMVVSPFNVSASSSMITAQWDIGLLIRNPSKRVYIAYNQIEVSIYYKEEFLCGTLLQSFDQKGRHQKLLKVSSVVLDKKLDNMVSSSLAEDMRKGDVEFNINLNTRFTSVGSTSIMAMSCPVRVGFLSNSTTTDEWTMSGRSSSCKMSMKNL